MTARCAAWLLAALLPACGAAAQPDAGVAADAAVCSVTPMPALPPLSGIEPEIVFDVELERPAPDQVGAVFVDAGGLIVFSSGVVYRLSLEGDGLVRTPIPEVVSVREVVQGAPRLGALVAMPPDPLPSFCVLDATGMVELARCARLPTADVRAVTFDGTGYRVFLGGEVLLRRRYDLDARPFDELELPGIGELLAASSVGERDRLYAREARPGSGCPTLREHVIEPAMQQVVELLPQDAVPGPVPVRVGSGPTGSSVVVGGACRRGESCAEVAESTALMSIEVGGAATAEGVAIPTASSGGASQVLRDGDRTLVLDVRRACPGAAEPGECTEVGVLWRYRPDGSVELAQRRVTPELRERVALSAAVIGPGDYAVLYLNADPLDQLRLRRVRIP